ncbi:MAG: TauD/TfdA family dioxygenase [Candidatus Nitrotoga sp.]
MMNIQPTREVLGATVTGIDLRRPLAHDDFVTLLKALGDHGVLRFPEQLISAVELKQFSENFGSLHVLSAAKYFEPGLPEVTILSNIKRNGKPVGAADAGQFWHTDMAYNHIVGFVNVLVAHEVPMRNGAPLGATEFTNTQAAYSGLPIEIKARLADAVAIHDLNKSWERSRTERNSVRPPLTEAQRREYPPVSHPVFLTHPITGRKVIYVTPSYVVNIEGMPPDESLQMLDFLCEHILKPEYRYVHRWAVGDVLMWDHLGTWHNAISDYSPAEPRLMKRCQVMANRIFDHSFLKATIGA